MAKHNKIYFFLALFILSCEDKVEINERYLKVYYEYIIDRKQSVKARIKYVRKLKVYSKKKSTAMGKKSLYYLNRAYLFLSNKSGKYDRLVFSEINKTFKNQGFELSRHPSDKRENNNWLEDEKHIRTRRALTMTASPDWDKRIYGKWYRRFTASAEQFRFFEDMSFEYIEVSGFTDKELDLDKLFAEESDKPSFVKRGEYSLSKNNNKLSLTYHDKDTERVTYSYNIFNNELYLNGEILPYQKVEE